MGGRSKRTPKPDAGDPIEPSVEDVPGSRPLPAGPAFLPGFQGLLAEQLAAGFGGQAGLLGQEQITPQSVNDYLGRLYAVQRDVPKSGELPAPPPTPQAEELGSAERERLARLQALFPSLRGADAAGLATRRQAISANADNGENAKQASLWARMGR